LLFARPQAENDHVLVKADRATLTAGKHPLSNSRSRSLAPLAKKKSITTSHPD
jgi:hypothetical protein